MTDFGTIGWASIMVVALISSIVIVKRFWLRSAQSQLSNDDDPDTFHLLAMEAINAIDADFDLVVGDITTVDSESKPQTPSQSN
ncbi:hypothetical protein DIURU_000107 [Diutina rugosa]|uniref:Uncharacterized protein n=1 Tax=Diutina rugosa TaxID=5481 RepID=A0A642UZL6_DIURU|nr:uncharacterized protein DIURU_000107 [Diutina rugosa]KAA8908564.1 hypothetical protein DIURU_000107 [Diutina rugosa]